MTIVLETFPDPTRRRPTTRYVRPLQPIHFPESEEMLETNTNYELRTILYSSLKREFAARHAMGSDQFLYYVPTDPKENLAPDVFVKLRVPHATFRTWKTWERGTPDLGVEIISDSDEGDQTWEEKLVRYRASGIAEVVRFDPEAAAHEAMVRVWDHIQGDLVERAAPEDGVLECVTLSLFWVVVEHPALGKTLRLSRDRAGKDLLITDEEAAVLEARGRAEAESAQAKEAAARAEAERARAQAESAQAEEARGRAQAESARDLLAAELAELKRSLAATKVNGGRKKKSKK